MSRGGEAPGGPRVVAPALLTAPFEPPPLLAAAAPAGFFERAAALDAAAETMLAADPAACLAAAAIGSITVTAFLHFSAPAARRCRSSCPLQLNLLRAGSFYEVPLQLLNCLQQLRVVKRMAQVGPVVRVGP